MQEKLEAGKWDLLVSKMKVVKVMSLLVKKMEEERTPWVLNYNRLDKILKPSDLSLDKKANTRASVS